MTYRDCTWRPALRVLALALVIAAVPLPGLAGEPSQTIARPGIRASAAAVVATTTLARSEGQSATDTKAQLESGSFFKTPVGVVVLAVVAAGAGYAIYSTRNDRIKSPGK